MAGLDPAIHLKTRLMLALAYSVSCLWPQFLQENLIRLAPRSAERRFGAPHLPQTASILVLPCLMTRFRFSMVSRISRSASSRIDCFDMVPHRSWGQAALLARSCEALTEEQTHDLDTDAKCGGCRAPAAFHPLAVYFRLPWRLPSGAARPWHPRCG